MKKKWRRYFDAFLNGLKDFFHEPMERTTVSRPERQADHALEQETHLPPNETAPKPSWWEKKNAEYFRDQCPIYLWWLFLQLWDFEQAFGKTLDRFFYSHASWRIPISFPESTVSFVAVNVYGLRPEWNRRDTDLKRILLSELRRAFVEYAASKGYNLSGIINCVIADIWLVGDALVMEIPQSEFIFRYPHLARVLASEDYWKFRQGLKKEDHF